MEAAALGPSGTSKRDAILLGALVVFARDSYSRASIDTIAAEAQVSTRTLYKHFADKATLFAAVMHHSATMVADSQIALMARLDNVDDLEKELTAFGVAWLTSMPDHQAHAALLRQIDAEREHIPGGALRAWRESGPRRVLTELGDRFRHLALQGLLRVDNPFEAAIQFAALITAEEPGVRPTDHPAAVRRRVASAVRVFLHGYTPIRSEPGASRP